MKKCFIAALCLSGLLLADDSSSGDFSLKGFKGFAGISSGLFTPFDATTASPSIFSYGIWGGIEMNFAEKFGARVYVDLNFTPPIQTTTAVANNQLATTFNMLVSGNIDLIWRPVSKFGIIGGVGFGDYFNMSADTTPNTPTQTTNNFALLANLGLQYNIAANHLIELNNTFIITYAFSEEAADGTVTRYNYAVRSYLHSINVRYAYRF